MPRSKGTPKKRRIDALPSTDENKDKKLKAREEREAIEILKNTPIHQVEEAAAIATRDAIQHWPSLLVSQAEEGDDKEAASSTGIDIPDWLDGLGFFGSKIPTNHWNAFLKLHNTIQQEMANSQGQKNWSSWSGSVDDPRRRAFGILPNTLGSNETIRTKYLDLSMPWMDDEKKSESKESLKNDKEKPTKSLDEENDDANNNKTILQQATAILEPDDINTSEYKEAIDWLCETFASQLPKKQQSLLLPYLNYSQLIAVQPNLHNGRTLLPIHVDHPLKDGFGVVIITIGMVGGGTLLLQNSSLANDNTNNNPNNAVAKLHIQQGQAYMLSGKARNSCAHGILADDSASKSSRESLNLRFGLHDFDYTSNNDCDLDATTTTISTTITKAPPPPTMIPSKDVLQHWESSSSSLIVEEDQKQKHNNKKK